jgi:hypothetical protein
VPLSALVVVPVLVGLVVVVGAVGVVGLVVVLAVEAGFVAVAALGLLLVVVVGLVVVVVALVGGPAPGPVAGLVVVLVVTAAWPPDGVALGGLDEAPVVALVALAAGAAPPALRLLWLAGEDALRPPRPDCGTAADPGELDPSFGTAGDDDIWARGHTR